MTYCISDIHGEYELFMRLLEKINYSDTEKLIVCGDIIDKGKASIKLVKTLFSMPNAYCIKGNHEFEFFKFYRTRMHSAIMDFDAILWQLQQYFPEDGHLLDWDTVDRLVELPGFIENDEFICVHAGLPIDADGTILPPSDASLEELVYDRTFKNPNIIPITEKCIIFGHTPTSYIQSDPVILTYPKDNRIVNSQNIRDYCKIHIDTGVSLNGVLGCFRTDDCRSFYVSR